MNQNIIRNIIVDIDMKRVNRTINTKATFNQKDDRTAVLICRVKMDGVMDITDCVVTAEILKPDMTTAIVKCQILDPINGVIAIGLTPQCLLVSGTVKCELNIQSDSQTLYSPVLLYTVVDNLFDISTDEVISTNEYPILKQLILEVENLKKELHDKLAGCDYE